MNSGREEMKHRKQLIEDINLLLNFAPVLPTEIQIDTGVAYLSMDWTTTEMELGITINEECSGNLYWGFFNRITKHTTSGRVNRSNPDALNEATDLLECIERFKGKERNG